MYFLINLKIPKNINLIKRIVYQVLKIPKYKNIKFLLKLNRNGKLKDKKE